MPRNKPLTDHEMYRFAANVPHFRGVFMRDTLPKRPWKQECGILNLDTNNGPGTHWTAYKKIFNTVVYFDSFGNLRPPTEIVSYFQNCDIFYNHNSFQDYSTTNCGQLCIYFLNFPHAKLLLKRL